MLRGNTLKAETASYKFTVRSCKEQLYYGYEAELTFGPPLLPLTVKDGGLSGAGMNDVPLDEWVSVDFMLLSITLKIVCKASSAFCNKLHIAEKSWFEILCFLLRFFFYSQKEHFNSLVLLYFLIIFIVLHLISLHFESVFIFQRGPTEIHEHLWFNIIPFRVFTDWKIYEKSFQRNILNITV